MDLIPAQIMAEVATPHLDSLLGPVRILYVQAPHEQETLDPANQDLATITGMVIEVTGKGFPGPGIIGLDQGSLGIIAPSAVRRIIGLSMVVSTW
jgi:hypothetical protein